MRFLIVAQATKSCSRSTAGALSTRGKAHGDRWAVRRDQGTHRRPHRHPGQVEGRGAGVDQAFP